MSVQRAGNAAAFVAAIERGNAAAQGLWSLNVISPEACAERLAAAARGDRAAMYELRIAEQALDYIHAIRRARDGLPCVLCEHRFWRDSSPRALVILCPETPERRAEIVNGVCTDCWGRQADGQTLLDTLANHYREHLFPELRVLPPMSAAGHA